jgi:hypothetical protein
MPGSFAGPWDTKDNVESWSGNVDGEFIFSTRNKDKLISSPGHIGIQGNENAVALAR